MPVQFSIGSFCRFTRHYPERSIFSGQARPLRDLSPISPANLPIDDWDKPLPSAAPHFALARPSLLLTTERLRASATKFRPADAGKRRRNNQKHIAEWDIPGLESEAHRSPRGMIDIDRMRSRSDRSILMFSDQHMRRRREWIRQPACMNGEVQ